MSARATVESVNWLPRRSNMTKIARAAATVNATNAQRTAFGDAESAKSENAAPSLVQWVRRRKCGIMGIAWPRRICAAIQFLVRRSAVMTSAEMSRSQGSRRGLGQFANQLIGWPLAEARRL